MALIGCRRFAVSVISCQRDMETVENLTVRISKIPSACLQVQAVNIHIAKQIFFVCYCCRWGAEKKASVTARKMLNFVLH